MRVHSPSRNNCLPMRLPPGLAFSKGGVSVEMHCQNEKLPSVQPTVGVQNWLLQSQAVG